MRTNHDLAVWLFGSSYRAFYCDGCQQPIVVSRTQWQHPIYILTLAVELGAGVVAHCAYQRCGLGVTQHSAPVEPDPTPARSIR
ncbi:hypothetical protein AB0I34_37345 [Kribbella sp. NPDC050281]|uniref:hypothetical protein n=1 Tax=Kribbella sp. NPDC050281 TaxID=3155515 RepID=UPI0033FC15B4